MTWRWMMLAACGVLTWAPLQVSAATYYLRADGTAPNKSQATGCGSASTAMNPGTHNGQTFQPGDTIILCSQGGVYRSRIFPPSGGSSSNPITYDGRGTAQMSAADIVTGWTRYSGNIWRAAVAPLPSEEPPQQVFIDGAFGDRKTGLTGLVNNKDWFWQSNTLYLYSSSDPDTAYSSPGVEAGARSLCFGLGGSDWLVITGITARHANYAGIKGYNPGSHLVIKNNLAEWNWQTGIDVSGNSLYTGITIEDNITRSNGAGGIAMLRAATNSVIRRNKCYWNGKFQSENIATEFHPQHRWTYGIKLWEDTGVQEGHQIYDNECFENGRGRPGDYQGRGSGIWLDALPGNPNNPTIIRHNLVYSNKGNGIFIEISGNTVTYGNVLIGNATNSGGINEFAAANIVIDARESWTTENNLVSNNTSIGGRYGIKVVTYGCSGCLVRNNTVTNNIAVGAVEHNLYCNFGGDNDGSRGYGNLYENNAFGAEHPGFISWGGVDYSTYSSWESAYGQPAYSITGDPQLAGTAPQTAYLLSTSPCRDTGQFVAVYVDGLRSSSMWPDMVAVGDQRYFGDGWEVGAYLYDGPGAQVIFVSDFEKMYAPEDWSQAIP